MLILSKVCVFSTRAEYLVALASLSKHCDAMLPIGQPLDQLLLPLLVILRQWAVEGENLVLFRVLVELLES